MCLCVSLFLSVCALGEAEGECTLRARARDDGPVELWEFRSLVWPLIFWPRRDCGELSERSLGFVKLERGSNGFLD